MINQNNTKMDKAQDSNKPSQAKYCLRKTIKPPNKLLIKGLTFSKC